MGKDPYASSHACPARQFDTEPADQAAELEPLPTDKVVTEDLHEPATRLNDADNEITRPVCRP